MRDTSYHKFFLNKVVPALLVLTLFSVPVVALIILFWMLQFPFNLYNLFTYFQELIIQNTLLPNIWYASIIALVIALSIVWIISNINILSGTKIRMGTTMLALVAIGIFGFVGYLDDNPPNLSVCISLNESGIKNRKKEPRIWYYQNVDSTLEFYKFPYHPLHGADLKPLSEEIVQKVREIYKKGLVRQMILTCSNPGIISIRRNDVIGSYSGSQGENGEFFYLELMPRNGTDSLTSTIQIGDERPVEISCYYDPEHKILRHPLLGEAIVSGQQIGNSLIVELTSNLQNPMSWKAKKMPEQI